MSGVERQDPLSTEVQSPLMAGFSDALNKLSDILNLKTVAYTDIPLTAVEISKDDQYRIYQADFGKKLWLKSPPIIVKKNGTVITENFTIDYIGGSISFQEDFRLTADDRVSVDATCLIAESETIKGINARIDKIEGYTSHNKGYYDTIEDLEIAIPTGEAGDYAFLGGEIDSIYLWDSESGNWKDIYKIQDLSGYYTKAEIDNTVTNLQNNINTNTENIENAEKQIQANADNITQNATAITENATTISENNNKITQLETSITENTASLTEKIEEKADKSVIYVVNIGVENWIEKSDGTFEAPITLEVLGFTGNEKIIIGLSDNATAEQRETARNALLSTRVEQGTKTLYVIADGEKPEISLNFAFIVLD